MNLLKGKTVNVDIGSLYACNTVVPFSFKACKVWDDNGQWQMRCLELLEPAPTVICNIPLLVIAITDDSSISDELANSLFAELTRNDEPWVVCLYEETLVIIPAAYFEKPLNRYTDVFYTKVKAD